MLYYKKQVAMIFSVSSPSFWLYFILFFVSIFFAFYIPGNLLIKKLKLSFLQQTVLGLIIGMVLWGFQGVIFGYLSLRWLSYIYLLAFFLIWLKFNLRNKSKNLIQLRKIKLNLLFTLLIALGSLLQLTIVWFNGVLTTNGLYFCCGNTSDNLFQLALTNQIVKNFPPFQPGMYGVIVQNYHYWSNLVVAELVRVFNLPLIATQYQYSTLLISLLLGLSVVCFGEILKISKAFTAWLLSFLYFGGDLIYLLLFFLGKGLNFKMSSLEDGSKFLTNLPRAFSVVVFFAGISLLVLWVRKRDLYSGLIMALVLGATIGFKVYTGIFALVGLSALAVYFIFKKDFKMLMPIFATFLISFAIYFPVNNNAGGLYFTGFWMFENFIVQKELGLSNLELARQVFIEHNNWIRLWLQESIFFILFTTSIFGTKLLGLIQSKKSFSLFPKELNIFLITGIFVSAVAGFFFQQKSGSANTFNFLVSVFIFSSIYASLTCYFWLSKINRKLKFIFILLILLLTVPRVVQEWSINANNLLRMEGFLVSNQELEGLSYLKEKTDRNSLVVVDNRAFLMNEDSPYMSFLADRAMFFSGKGILNSHGINILKRSETVNTIVKNSDQNIVNLVLKENNINYIYMYPRYNIAIEKSDIVETVFENKKVRILKVK